MSWGTKIALFLVLVLCCVGGYFIHQKIKSPTTTDGEQIADVGSQTDQTTDTDDEKQESGRHGRRRHDSHDDDEVKLTGAVIGDPLEDSSDRHKHHRGRSQTAEKDEFDFEENDDDQLPEISAGQTEPDIDDPFSSNDRSPRSGRHNHGPRKHDSSEGRASLPVLSLDDDSPHDEENLIDSQGSNAANSSTTVTLDENSANVNDASEDPFFGQSRPQHSRRDRHRHEQNDLFEVRDGNLANEETEQNSEQPQPLFGSRHRGQQGERRDDFDEVSQLDDENANSYGGRHRGGYRGSGWNDGGETADIEGADDQLVPDEIDDLPGETTFSHRRNESRHSPGGMFQENDNGQGSHDLNIGELQVYVVQESDNFWKIAKEVYGAASYFNALAEFNRERIPDPQKMRPGMKVIIPPRELLERKYPQLIATLKSSPSDESIQQSAFDGPRRHAKPGLIQPVGFFVGPEGRPSYRVGKEDTLSDIAKTHLGRASRWSQIYQLNRHLLPTPHSLQVGMVLELPADASRVVLVNEQTFTR